MIHCLLDMVVAEAAIKIVANIIMPSLQHVACVETIMEHEPTKNFDFHSAFRPPKLAECLMRPPIPEVIVVVVPWFVKRGPEE